MEATIPAYINPLGPYLTNEDLSGVLAEKRNQLQELNRKLLESFFGLPASAFSGEMLGRYVEATTEDLHCAVVPHTEHIFENILRPLTSAKKNYAPGDYLACIAACGVVGEALAVLAWIVHDLKLNDRIIGEGEEKKLFGRVFKKLGQSARLDKLVAFGLITKEQRNAFDVVKKSRDQYLHLWRTKMPSEKDDALGTFKAALKLFKSVMGVDIKEGKMVVNPLIIRFCERQMKEKKEEKNRIVTG